MQFHNFEGSKSISLLQFQLFRPCFKKLFNICEMYGKDLAKKNNRGGTGQLLNKIAKQNVDTVISLEEHILENIS